MELSWSLDNEQEERIELGEVHQQYAVYGNSMMFLAS